MKNAHYSGNYPAQSRLRQDFSTVAAGPQGKQEMLPSNGESYFLEIVHACREQLPGKAGAAQAPPLSCS